MYISKCMLLSLKTNIISLNTFLGFHFLTSLNMIVITMQYLSWLGKLGSACFNQMTRVSSEYVHPMIYQNKCSLCVYKYKFSLSYTCHFSKYQLNYVLFIFNR